MATQLSQQVGGGMSHAGNEKTILLNLSCMCTIICGLTMMDRFEKTRICVFFLKTHIFLKGF